VSPCQTAVYQDLYELPSNSDDAYAVSPVTQALDGNFYLLTTDAGDFIGVTATGEPIFVPVDLDGEYNPVSFFSGLIQGPNGNFFGTGMFEGRFFELPGPGYSGAEFPYFYVPDAAYSGVILGSDGAFYGTTNLGGMSSGSSSCGSVFKVSQTGVVTTLYEFTGKADGCGPAAGLVQGRDGNFYGTTPTTIFRLSPSGVIASIAAATSAGTALVQAADGDLYGVNEQSVFRVNPPTGALTTIATAAGGAFQSTLFPAGGNTFYGVTAPDGTAYAISTTGILTPLGIVQTSGTAGRNFSSVVQGNDGNIYGSFSEGPGGTFYKLTFSQPQTPPVQITLSPQSVLPGTPVTASFTVNNAYSLTMQQCYAFVTVNGVTTALGKVAGTYSSATTLYTGSVSFTPTAGTYHYDLTCGGIESGLATLFVGYPTATTLTANPTTVTPPGTVSLQATVKRSANGVSGTPTGSVTFSSGSANIGTANLNGSGVAIFSASSSGIAAGQYPVTARYNGDSEDAASTSASVTVTVE
jgi:uncharacterized repeat protein (TIGR03803 family)